MHMILIALFFVLQWASILVNLTRIDKKEKVKRQIHFRRVFCSIGLPSILGLVISVILLFTPAPWWISVCVYILLSIIFAFTGSKVYSVLFKNSKTELETKKINSTHSSKNNKNKGKKKKR